MRIGIMTFHASCNCGSMLQAFALQHVLQTRYGADVEIIDYSNAEQRNLYGVLDFMPRRSALKNDLDVLRTGAMGYVKQRNADYKEFKTHYFNLSPKSYTKKEQLSDVAERYDLLVAGGDQVWNVSCRDQDDAYFLDFADGSKVRKVAYSPSLGGRNINRYSPDIEHHKRLLADFERISVREGNGQKWLQELTGREVPIIADPTMLLTKEEWREALPLEDIDRDYIFYYSFSYADKRDNDALMEVSRHLGKPVIILDGKQWKMWKLADYGVELYPRTGPIAFLSLIDHASLVITQSFHGSVLSAVFEKPFISINNQIGTGSEDDRAMFILSQLGLTDRYIPLDGMLGDCGSISVDVDAVRNRCGRMRAEAFDYIDSFMGRR
jgi:hypothetical protein